MNAKSEDVTLDDAYRNGDLFKHGDASSDIR